MAGGPEDHFTDSRELYVLVEGDEWAHVEALDPDAGYWARRFAQLVNWRARGESDAELTVVRAARHAHDVVTPAADRPIARLLQLATSMSIPVGPSTDRCSRAVRLDASESRRALAASHQLGGSAWALTRKIG